jgi:protocatechuate 3,4-dioxygenase beta subunit
MKKAARSYRLLRANTWQSESNSTMSNPSFWTAAVIITVLVTGGATAQGPTLREKHAIVEGTVTVLGTDAAIGDVVVSFTSVNGSSQQVTTDGMGRFIAEDITPGSYTVSAVKPGFIRLQQGDGLTRLTLRPDQHITGVGLHLVPTAVIAGCVRDENQNYVSGFRVQAMRYTYVNGQRSLVTVATSQTDDHGDYRLAGLPPGEYLVRTSALITSADYQPTFYPGSGDRGGATPIPAIAGADLGGLNITLSRANPHTIKVQLPPLIGAKSGQFVDLSIIPDDGVGFPIRMQSSGSNSYSAKLGRGKYVLNAAVRYGSISSSNNRGLYGSIPIVIADDDLDIGIMPLESSVDLTGTFFVPKGLPIDVGKAQVSLVPMDERFSNAVLTSTVAPDGAFQISDVPYGRYRIAVSGLPPTVYLEMVSYNTRVAADHIIVVGEDPPGTLGLQPNGPAGDVQGIVQNSRGASLSNAQVALVPPLALRSNPDFYRTAFTDQEGFFIIRGVVPGEYRVLAWEEIEHGAYQNDEFVRRYENGAVAISVQRGATNTLTLQAFPRGK